MRLLERASPLGSLAACVAEARRGDGRLVLVAGKAGVGKSALVEQLQREVPDAHWSWGRATACSPPAGAGAAGNAGLRSPRRHAAADLRCGDPGEIPGERR
jgi:hypothetical protein